MDRFLKTKQEIQNMTEDEFIQYMDNWNKYTELKRQKLYETTRIPNFTSVDEIKDYYHGITFNELEQNLT